MSFDNHYPSRKDHRAPYQKKAPRLDSTCRPGGSCLYCQGNRAAGTTKRLLATSLSDWEEYLPLDYDDRGTYRGGPPLAEQLAELDDGRGMDLDDSTGQF